MKSFSETVTKDLMTSRRFKVVLMKCSFDFANIRKLQCYHIGVKFSCVKQTS